MRVLTIFLLCSDIDKIRDGLGDKVALMINAFSAFLAGFIIAFVIEWRLALLLLAFIPLLALAALAYTKVSEPSVCKLLSPKRSHSHIPPPPPLTLF